MEKQLPATPVPDRGRPGSQATVFPGNCGFSCAMRALPAGRRAVTLQLQSDCAQIRLLGTLVPEVSLQELFLPLSRNPVFRGAERAGCHSACPIPAAIVKTAEVALGLALAQDVTIRFSTAEPEGSEP